MHTPDYRGSRHESHSEFESGTLGENRNDTGRCPKRYVSPQDEQSTGIQILSTDHDRASEFEDTFEGRFRNGPWQRRRP